MFENLRFMTRVVRRKNTYCRVPKLSLVPGFPAPECTFVQRLPDGPLWTEIKVDLKPPRNIVLCLFAFDLKPFDARRAPAGLDTKANKLRMMV